MPHSRNVSASPSSPVAVALAGLLALAVAMGIGRFAFTPILPMMLEDAGLSIADSGLLASANYVGYFCGALLAMAIRIRDETALRGGLVAIALVTLAMGLHLPLFGWLLMRLLAGVASAWVLISVSAWSLETLARYQRPLLNSLVFSGVGTGIAIAGFLCLVLIGRHASSSQAWIALGAFSAAVTALIWRYFGHAAAPANEAGAVHKPADKKGDKKENKEADKEAHRWNADSLRLVFCYGMFGFGYIIPATFLPVMAKKALAGTPLLGALFGWTWPVFGLAAALSTLAAAMLIRRAGNRQLWIGSHLAMAAGVALPALWPHAAAIFIAALLVGGTFMVITLVAMQEARRVAKRRSDSATLIAAMTSAFAAGQIAGPLLITYGFTGEAGLSHALLVAAGSLVASAAVLAVGDGATSAIIEKENRT